MRVLSANKTVATVIIAIASVVVVVASGSKDVAKNETANIC